MPKNQVSGQCNDPASNFVETFLIALPDLRRFARKLSYDPADAEDLVQETSIRALTNQHRFQVGTNMRSWLYTICRNLHYARWKREQRFCPLHPQHLQMLEAPGGQEASFELGELAGQLDGLPAPQRMAYVLVNLGGCTYQEAATLEACAVGTMKSRVSRAKEGLEPARSRNGQSEALEDCLRKATGVLVP